MSTHLHAFHNVSRRRQAVFLVQVQHRDPRGYRSRRRQLLEQMAQLPLHAKQLPVPQVQRPQGMLVSTH